LNTIDQFGSAVDSDQAWAVYNDGTDFWIGGSTGKQAFICDQSASDCTSWTPSTFGAANPSEDAVRGLTVDGSGDVLVVGKTEGTNDFDTALGCTNLGGDDGWYGKFDTATSAISTCDEFATNGKDEGLWLATAGTYTFLAQRVSSGLGGPPNDGDTRVSVYNNAGFVTSADIATDDLTVFPVVPQFDEPGSIAAWQDVGGDIRVYVVGGTSGDVSNAAGFTSYFGSPNGGWDAWVAQYTFDGVALTPDWIFQFGTHGDDFAQAVGVYGDEIAVAGRMAEQINDPICQAGVPNASFSDLFTTYFEVSAGVFTMGAGYPKFDIRGDCSLGDVASALVIDGSHVTVVGGRNGGASHLVPSVAEDGVLLSYPIANAGGVGPYTNKITSPTIKTIAGKAGFTDSTDRPQAIAENNGHFDIVGWTLSDLTGAMVVPATPDAFWIHLN
jgi:hypothetical protein